MDWKGYAIKELRNYYSYKKAYKNNLEKIETINSNIYLITGIDYSKEPVMGGSLWAYEDNIVSQLCEKDRFIKLNEINKKLIDSIESGLNGLSEDEKQVLEIFYMNRPSNHITVAQKKLYCSRSAVFNKKNEALRKYMLNKFGGFEFVD